MPFCLCLTARSFTLAGPITVSRLPIPPPHFHFTRAVAAGSDMAASTVQVTAAQTTSVNNLTTNFTTCSLLIKGIVLYVKGAEDLGFLYTVPE